MFWEECGDDAPSFDWRWRPVAPFGAGGAQEGRPKPPVRACAEVSVGSMYCVDCSRLRSVLVFRCRRSVHFPALTRTTQMWASHQGGGKSIPREETS